MREVNIKEITALTRSLCIDANYNIPKDIREAFCKGQQDEKSELGKEIFGKMIENCDMAAKNSVPICQDTGMAVVFVEVGQDVHITGGLLEDAINEGVRQGYIDGFLRCSVVADPINRVNTDDNTPAIIYTSIVAGNQIHIMVAPKGFGSENMSAMKMFTPAASIDDIINFVVDCCDKAGSNPCPPIVVGVGLGGTSDKAAYLAKKALTREAGKASEHAFYAEMEGKILDKINKLGIGPQGLGGSISALSVAIEPFATHIAGLPCVVNIGCHVTRHAEGNI